MLVVVDYCEGLLVVIEYVQHPIKKNDIIESEVRNFQQVPDVFEVLLVAPKEQLIDLSIKLARSFPSH